MKRRLILHAGTPKTGTTALQLRLEADRDKLMEQGFFYPPTGGGPSPRHQWMIQGLLGDGRPFLEQLRSSLATVREDVHTVILSSEGVYNHWWDFSAPGRGALKQLGEEFHVELWIWFREPAAFIRSFYIQMLKNPRIPGNPCYGYNYSIEQMLDIPWFTAHLDYAGFIAQAEGILGSGSVRAFPYASDTVCGFYRALGLDCEADARTENRSIGEIGADMVRVLNRRDLPAEPRRRAVEAIEALDAELAPLSGPLQFSAETQMRIAGYAALSIAFLETNYGIAFSGRSAQPVQGR